jgi:hypothetical protein
VRGEFCRVHAFYDCPVCKGEEVVWVIPIVDGADPFGGGGNVIGTIEIPESFDDTLGSYEIPWEGPGRVEPPMPLPAPVAQAEPSPDLLEQVRAIFSITNEPQYREAAARGRKVHSDALTLIAEVPGLSYSEAVAEIIRQKEEDR